MSVDVIIILAVIFVLTIFFLLELLPLDLTALIGTLLLISLGFLSAEEAFSGFSSPTIIILVGMYFLSTALQSTGVTQVLGKYLARISGDSERSQIFFVMLLGGAVSSIMQNVATVILLLPAVVSLAAEKGTSPSKLLMPLSFAVVLGGMTTSIGGAPNILVSEIIQKNTGEAVSFFSFTPIGLIVYGLGLFAFWLLGPKLLPGRKKNSLKLNNTEQLLSIYKLEDRIFSLRISPGSILIGQALKSVRLGDLFSMEILAIKRGETVIDCPSADIILSQNDILLVQGKYERFLQMLSYSGLTSNAISNELLNLIFTNLRPVVFKVKQGSSLVKDSFRHLNFRAKYQLSVFALERDQILISDDISRKELKVDDIVYAFSADSSFEKMQETLQITILENEVSRNRISEHLKEVYVGANSPLLGRSIKEAALGELFGITIICLVRDSKPIVAVDPSYQIQNGDSIIVVGSNQRLENLVQLTDLQVESENMHNFLHERQSLMLEILPAPRSSIVGKTLKDLRFRDRYNLQVLAIWRAGSAIRGRLADISIEIGDALLVYGPKSMHKLFFEDTDFLCLNYKDTQPVSKKKAGLAIASIILMLICSVSALMPIHIATTLAAVFLAATRVVSMEQVYKNIDWRLVFLIAALMPLGLAVENSGAAAELSKFLFQFLDHKGVFVLICIICLLASIFSQCLDTAPTVVVLAPIIIHLSRSVGIASEPLLMVLAYSSSVAFMTPFSHKVHLIIMGPGGYKVSDYFWIGSIISLLSFAGIILGYYAFY